MEGGGEAMRNEQRDEPHCDTRTSLRPSSVAACCWVSGGDGGSAGSSTLERFAGGAGDSSEATVHTPQDACASVELELEQTRRSPPVPRPSLGRRPRVDFRIAPLWGSQIRDF